MMSSRIIQEGVLNMELSYRQEGDYLLPNLTAPTKTEVTLGKYAHMRLQYLKNHRRITYANLLTQGLLTAHLVQVEESAMESIRTLTHQMAKAENVTEQMKSENQMQWIGQMNNIQQRATELTIAELIFN